MVDEYHIRQYDQMYESTRCLLEFIEECVGPIGAQHILNIACVGPMSTIC